jgi:HAD superfamily hydrolase (TIGR01490 family)
MKLAIFDFDGTLLIKDTLPALGKEWNRQKRSRTHYIITLLSIAPVLLLYKAKFMPRESMKSLAFKRFNRLFNKMNRKEIEEFFLQAYPELCNMFNVIVLQEIKRAQEQGFHCVLLSGAYSDLLKIVARELGIDTVIGAELAYNDGVFDPKGDTPFIDGKSKRSLLLDAFSDEDIDWEASRAFGDSYGDVWVMELVGERVAVNPDPQLLAYAQKNSWQVITA